ncbi:MAG TPA: CehA/McbA family metallohydrolase [Anaerolineales bacterium]|nr:CehA/McbA family metallohydrolase [Anaerolineales bacterium]
MDDTVFHELIGNLHVHSVYSDGSGTPSHIIRAALNSGLDFLALTDHNVLVDGYQGYHELGSKRLLVLTGEELHDPTLRPSGNHILLIGISHELAHLAKDPSAVAQYVAAHTDGLAFLAHPHENHPHLPTQANAWYAPVSSHFTGFELWNYTSSQKQAPQTSPPPAKGKGKATSLLASSYAPPASLFQQWDEWLVNGQRMVALGTANAHGEVNTLATEFHLPISYAEAFRTVNTHLLLKAPLSPDATLATRQILSALQHGQCFVGFDAPYPTKGFRFFAQNSWSTAQLGDEISISGGVTLQASAPARCTLRIIHNGKVVRERFQDTHISYSTVETGAYRVEGWIEYRQGLAGWIFSNPIFLI